MESGQVQAISPPIPPVLLIYGEKGVLGPEPMEGWAGALPNARLLSIPDAQHYPHVDRPEMFFPAAEAFLSGVWPENARYPDREDSKREPVAPTGATLP